MKYALGNMLNGAGGINADQLALDLQFAADKTLTARKGPTPTFTRASSGTFVGSNGLIQSASNNVARFDHDPVTLASRGLLIEESRTNLTLQSEGFSTGSWTKSGSTVTADSIASPDGAVTADLLNEDSGLSTHFTQQAVPSLTAGQSYTFSVFAKAGSHTSFQISLSVTAFGGGVFANFVLTGSGSVGTSSGVTASIQSYPNGWYRCNVTIASVTGGAGGFASIVANNNNSSSARNPSYQGTGAQVVYLWGAQLELGSFATSYIPTTTASVVRSADVCSISGGAFSGIWNASEGTMFASGMRYHGVSSINSRIWSLHQSGAAATGINAVRTASGEFLASTSGSVDILNMGSSYAAFQSFKQACRIKQGDYAGSQNGLTTVTSANNYTYLANTLSIGYYLNGGAYHNGCLSAIRFYKKGLPNAKLQALTV